MIPFSKAGSFFGDFLTIIKRFAYFCSVKKGLIIFSFFICCLLATVDSTAQCAMCTKTAQQLGEKPAQGLNAGILYLMLAPFSIVGFIAYRWWKNNKEAPDQ